jgi:Ca2+-binding RTX toxin-like protein
MSQTTIPLPVDTKPTALDMAETMFGDGVDVVSASYVGDPRSSGIYTNGEKASPGVVPADSGVILSTGFVANVTNATGPDNARPDTSADTTGVNGDKTLNALAGVKTFDAAILTAEFIPAGDTLTMQLVFASEEYPEWVNQGFNDVVAIHVNGELVQLALGDGEISIDNINETTNANLYVDNTKGTLNTEMDGVTIVLTLKAPVKPGEVNNISVAIADGGDAFYDSSLLIIADSVQTALIANDDRAALTQKGEGVFDLLANDTTMGRKGVVITAINGQAVQPGESVHLPTGETVTLNKDGTISVMALSSSDQVSFSYTIRDAVGTTDTGFVTMDAKAVEGTDGNDSMHVGYVDANGRQIDGKDGLSEVIHAYGGNDKITAGLGDDDIFGGTGNDFIRAGDGNDSLWGGEGNDVLDGQIGNDGMAGGRGDDVYWIDSDGDVVVEAANEGYDKVMSDVDHVLGLHFEELWLNEVTAATSAQGNAMNNKIVGNSNNNLIIGLEGNDKLSGNSGDDSLYGDAGNDDIWGGVGQDHLFGGVGNDKLYAEDGNDFLFGGAGNDQLNGGSGDDVIDGGAGSDILGGGFGADVFVLAAGGGRDTVTDFQDGTDLIAVQAATMAGVKLKAISGGTEVTIGNGDTLFLKGVGIAQIDASDFILG